MVKMPLYKYQQTGVEFLTVAGSAILADDMGLGKSSQAIAAIQMLDAYPALVVCPKSVKRNWAREFAMWAPKRTVTVVDSTGAKKAKQLAAETDVLVVNYESLRTASRLAPYGSIRLSPAERQPGPLNRNWGAVIADEAHRAKDPHAKQTRALWAVAASARHRFALTGTPVANSPEDFWALLHLVASDEWPARTTFLDRYCRISHDWHGGVSVDGLKEETKAEFFAIADPRFLRRPKALVLPDLPPKIHETRWVEMAPKQAKAYRDMEKDQVAWLDDRPVAAFDGLTVLGRLIQFASAAAEVAEDGMVRLAEPSSKLDAFEDVLDDLGPTEQVVAFAQSRQLIDLAAARLDKGGVTYGRVSGAESERQRQDAIERFQAGELRVMLCTLGAGSVGITLTAARTVVFLQRSFNAVENAQAEDRVHRIGQEADSVLIVDLVAQGTVEETAILPTLEGKAELLEEVARDREALRRMLVSK